MRADRLLTILLHLQVHQRVTTRELARRLEVSERTIHRDMEALGAAGVPVVAERGQGGGWHLMEKYQTNLTGLSESETQALFLAQPSMHLLDDLGLNQASEAAVIKLLAALPSLSRRNAEYARQRIHVDAAGWYHTPETIAYLPVIQEAIWQERKLRFLYARGEEVIERVADPLGLVAKGTIWYMVAAVEGRVRSYRISRVQAVEILEEPCERPEGFDLAEFWQQSTLEFKSNLPQYHTVVRVHPELWPQMKSGRRFAKIEQVAATDQEGWLTLALQFDVESAALEYILSQGSSIEILEPATLREKVYRTLQQAMERYQQANELRSSLL